MYVDKFCDKTYDNILDTIKRVHFVGIGGSGMCPLAEILISEGYKVSGSDTSDGDTLRRIKGYGIPVFMGHDKSNVNGAELVVYTAAVKQDNPGLFPQENKVFLLSKGRLCSVLFQDITRTPLPFRVLTEKPQLRL